MASMSQLYNIKPYGFNISLMSSQFIVYAMGSK